jgi:hypothetical protein
MKRLSLIILAIIFALSIALSAQAASTITFAWDASNEAAGYHVYKSPNNVFSKTSTKVCAGVTALTCTVLNVPDGLMHYAATAYDSAGNESDFSDSISYNGDTTAPAKPAAFKITVTVTVTP